MQWSARPFAMLLARPCSIPGQGRHIWCNNLALNIEDCVSLGNKIIMLMLVLPQFSFGRKRTTEDDDKHPGNDHPQCQHRNGGLA